MSNVSLIDGNIDNAEHCVCCGAVIPEGRQVCIICGLKTNYKQSTSDVVEVVRCKDCKHAILDLMEKGMVVCRRPVLKNGQLLPFNWENKYNDFCSYGERKDGE